jgi:hypothetical protein
MNLLAATFLSQHAAVVMLILNTSRGTQGKRKTAAPHLDRNKDSLFGNNVELWTQSKS